MKDDGMEIVRGSGNVFRDFNHPQADIMQAKAILAAKIIHVLDEKGWSAREAARQIGVEHTDLSRIRNVKLDRFTIERLIAILGKFDQEVQLNIEFRPRPTATAPAIV